MVHQQALITQQRLVALTGRKGCGKTTLARGVGCHPGQIWWIRNHFAGPLKSALLAMGLTDEQVNGDEKEVPLEILGGKTPRYAMQTLGTEWGRKLISGSLWVDLAMREIDQTLACATQGAMLDDCRFDNEAEAVRERGGFVIQILRAALGPATDKHASEAGVSPELITHTITNDDSIQSAVEKILDIVKGCK